MVDWGPGSDFLNGGHKNDKLVPGYSYGYLLLASCVAGASKSSFYKHNYCYNTC